MVETPPSGARNKKLLLAAFLLGVVFVVLFNIQGCIVARRRARNQMDFVLVTRDIKAEKTGTKLEVGDIERITLPKEEGQRIKGLLEWHQITVGQTKVRVDVEKSSLLRKTDIREPAFYAAKLLRDLKANERTVNLKVTKIEAPAAHLRRGAHVDVYGVIASVKGVAPQLELIFSDLEVMAVGEEGEAGETSDNFRTITVKVKADVMTDFLRVRDRVQGEFTITIRKPGTTPTVSYATEEKQVLTEAARRALTLP